MFGRYSLVGWLILSLLAACSLNEANPPNNPSGEVIPLRAEANRDTVFVVRENQRETLPLIQQATLLPGEGLAVDEVGRATLTLDDLLTIEILQASELNIQTTAQDSQSIEIFLQQNGGLFYSNFNPEKVDDRRLSLQTEMAMISTTAARFMVTHEAGGTAWVVNLGSANDIIEITTAGEIQSLPGGTAIWLTTAGISRNGVPIDVQQAESWFEAIRGGTTQPSFSEIILPPADVIGNTSSLTVLPQIDQPFELGTSERGNVSLTLDPIGLFGAPTYTLEDCNGDGSQDLSILAGRLHFDFSKILARTRALDVVVVNRNLPGNGALWAMDALGNEVARQLFEVGGGSSQTLSLRSTEPYHSAQLALVDGCFVGFSLTPPTSAGTPAPPRVVTLGQPQSSTVVNLLAQNDAIPESTAEVGATVPATAVGQQREVNQIDAWPLADSSLTIDGDLNDWNRLAQQNRTVWTSFETIVYNEACANRFPGAENSADLNGQVLFAYDEQFLYLAFQVADEGFVGYSGPDQQYFLGDSAQLSLDMQLLGDYNDTGRSQDDWQVDFSPDPAAPLAVLWQLSSLSARRFEEATVAATTTPEGYLLEAKLPWRSLGTAPQPGDRLGLAANINDNDTPGSDVQECIISTAPQRAWNDPTTWGILFLRPAE